MDKWTPHKLNNLAVWWDASDTRSTITGKKVIFNKATKWGRLRCFYHRLFTLNNLLQRRQEQ